MNDAQPPVFMLNCDMSRSNEEKPTVVNISGHVASKNLTSLAFERLRADILSGALLPAERLRIQALSERYRVGATAIREALSRLVTDGLVIVEDQRGFNVAPVSRDELLDLTRTRIHIEQIALRMAVENGDIEWESRLLSNFHRLSRTPAPTTTEHHAAWSDAHRRFHEALIAGCGSDWTLRLCRLLYDKSERYRNVAERKARSNARDVSVEHQKMLDAAMARDAETLCQTIDKHFWETTNIIFEEGLAGSDLVGGRDGPTSPQQETTP